MNILIAVDKIGSGGAEISAIRIANTLVEKNKVYLLNINESLTDKRYLSRIDVRVSYIHFMHSSKVADFVLWKIHAFFLRLFAIKLRDRFRIRWIKKFLKKENIHVVNSHSFYTDHLFSSIKKRFALVTTLHGHYEDIYRNDKMLIQNSIPSIYNSVDQFIYLTEKNRDVFKHAGYDTNQNFTKIYTGYVTFGINKRVLGKNLINDQKKFIYGAIGRGVPEKGWYETLHAFSNLRKKYSNITLVCVGAKDYINQLIRDEKIDDIDVINLPVVEDILNIIRQFHSMILSSYFESLPNIVVESISLEVPVIATDVGEIRNMIDFDSPQPCGLLVPLTRDLKPDIEILEKKMEQYLTNKELYFAHKKHTKSSFKKFSIDKCREAYVDVFRKALSKTK